MLRACRGKRLLAARELLVACLGGEIRRIHIVVLLLRGSVVAQELGIARFLAPRVFEFHTCLFNAGIGDQHIILGGVHALRSGLLAGKGVGEVGCRLRQPQAKLAVFDNQQGVALMHGLEFFEADFFDEALNTGVHGRDVLPHGGIVGKLHVAEVHEILNHKCHTGYNQHRDDGIIGYLNKFSVIHKFIIIKFKLRCMGRKCRNCFLSFGYSSPAMYFSW